jgi:hypothetical protein
MKEGSVETLTSMKLLLAEKCQAVQGFPKGELRSRRKLKRISTSSCLEERLSGDIAELINFLETEVVTSEIRNMFDNMAVTSVDHEEHHNTIQVNKRAPSPFIQDRSSGWTGMKNQICCIQTEFQDFVGLEDKIEELLVIIKTLQDSEITSLQKQNENNSCKICICHTDGGVHHPSGPSLQLLNKTVVDNCTIVSQDNGSNASISNNNNGVITLTSSNSSDYSADNSGSMQSSETVVRKESYADVIRTPKRNNNNKTSQNATIKPVENAKTRLLLVMIK